jgi:hypothetical protein
MIDHKNPHLTDMTVSELALLLSARGFRIESLQYFSMGGAQARLREAGGGREREIVGNGITEWEALQEALVELCGDNS